MPEIRIDDQVIDVPTGSNLLEVARANGIGIPTLCHHEAIQPYASCRLCVVELMRDGWSQLVTSCIYTVRRPITVRTNSEKVRRARKLVLELLLARCPDSDEIRKLAEVYGITEPRFPVRGDTTCILCGNCVRVCREVIGASAIGYAGRGGARKVTTPFDEQSQECIACGACAFVCPTGYIKWEDVDNVRRMITWNTERALQRCAECGEVIAPLPQFEKLQSLTDVAQELMALCPRCRRRKYGRVLALGEAVGCEE